jgi:type IV conjugative transfer system protein TraE
LEDRCNANRQPWRLSDQEIQEDGNRVFSKILSALALRPSLWHAKPSSTFIKKDMVAMRFDFHQSTLQKALKQKDLALWACLGLTLANLALVTKVTSSEEKWVLIPQNDVGHHIPLSSSKYSDKYFIDWANNIVQTILCVNPDSIDWKTHQILEITITKYGDLKEQLQNDAERVKHDQISTVFYPKQFNVSQATQTVEVKGQHIAYFGKDSEPVTTEKTYRLTWVVREHGLVFLKDFVEIKDAK